MVTDALAFLAFSASYTPSHRKDTLIRLKGANWKWVHTASLFEVAIRLLAIRHDNPKIINSTCLAFLVKRLIATETTAGGPYKDSDDHVDIATNIAIAQLLVQLGELPSNLGQYVDTHITNTSAHLPQAIVMWLSSWPTHIVKKASPPLFIARNQQYATMRPLSSQRVRVTINTLKEPLRSEALSVWHSVNAANKKLDITHQATFFAQSLTLPPPHGTRPLYDDLGEANFYAWMAYTIYDDFIDDSGNDRRLSVANSMHRRALLLYTKHAPDTINPWQYFDQMDEANAWELAHCRAVIRAGRLHVDTLPNYKRLSTLAARSSVHILGPIIIAAMSANYTALHSVETGLRHYLIARQLNDDLHDWKQDLERGHLSPVVTHLLDKTGLGRGHFALGEITPILQRYFWHKGITTTTRRIRYHVKKSKELLLKDGLITNANNPFFTNILTPIEASAMQADTAQREQKNFLDSYKSM